MPNQSTNANKEKLHKQELEEVLSALMRRFRWIEDKLSMYSDDDSRVERYTNSEQRIAKSITDVVALVTNRNMLDLSEEIQGDLARMIEDVQNAKKKQAVDSSSPVKAGVDDMTKKEEP